MSYRTLRVYQAAQVLRAEVDELARFLKPRFRRLFEHVDDAVDSIMNNIAEGSGSVFPRKAANFFDIAAGSAREVQSGLTSLNQRAAFKDGAPVFRSIVLALAIGKMLRALIAQTRE